MKLTVNPPPQPVEETYSVEFTRKEKEQLLSEIYMQWEKGLTTFATDHSLWRLYYLLKGKNDV